MTLVKPGQPLSVVFEIREQAENLACGLLFRVSDELSGGGDIAGMSDLLASAAPLFKAIADSH